MRCKIKDKYQVISKNVPNASNSIFHLKFIFAKFAKLPDILRLKMNQSSDPQIGISNS